LLDVDQRALPGTVAVVRDAGCDRHHEG
jgi:hypothetical protein